VYLARRYGQGPIGASDIAAGHGLDLQYTQQILHRLKKGEIIESTRGPHGGYRLCRDPEVISLREILLAVEGATFQIICDYAPIHPSTDLSTECATKESCSLHGVWKELQGAIDELLERRKLSDLAKLETITPDALVQVGKKAHDEQTI